MSVEENKVVIRRIVEEVWNAGNTALIPELLGTDYVKHSPGGDELRGLESVARVMGALRAAFPDFRMEIENLFGEGDQLAYQLRTHGTFLGKFRDIEPTGKSFTTRVSIIARFDNRKVVEEFEYMTEPSFLEQVGIAWRPRRQ